MSNINKQINISLIFAYYKSAYKVVLSKWKLVIIVGLTGVLLGFLFAQLKSPEYKARISFLLNENDPMGSFNLSSIAGLAGITSIGGGNTVNEDKLIFLAESRTLLGKTLVSRIKETNEIIVNRIIDTYKFKSVFKSDTFLKDFEYFEHSRLDSFTDKENAALDIVIKFLVNSKLYQLDVKKKSGIVAQYAGIVALEFKSKDQLIAKNFIEEWYDNLTDYYTRKTISKQSQNYNLIQNRADSILNLLHEKESYGANIYDENFKVVRAKGRVELERTKKEIEMLYLMYGEVLKNLEIAKFTLDNQLPVFQLIDSPTYPLPKKKLSRLYTGIGVGLVFTLILIVYIVIKNNDNIMSRLNQDS